MTATDHERRLLPDNALRMLLWGGAGSLLLLPWIAMQFTAEVNWTGFDFLVFGAMLGAVCIACEIALRASRSHAYRLAAVIAVGTGFLLVWINLAVGIIGSESNLENLVYAGVLAVAAIGAAVTRLRAAGMARAMLVTAGAHALTGVYGLAIGASIEAGVSALVFVAAWLASAWGFHRAAKVDAQR